MTSNPSNPVYPPIETLLPENFCVCEEALQYDFSALFDREEALRHLAAANSIWRTAQFKRKPTCVEICAGAGGQAIGLDMAGFEPLALVGSEPVLKEKAA